MKFITSSLAIFIWTLVMLIADNARTSTQVHSTITIHVEIQDMLKTIDKVTINPQGTSGGSYSMRKDKRNTNIYSADIPINPNEWMTKFLVQASSSRQNGKTTEILVQGTPIWRGLKNTPIPIYHYNALGNALENLKTTQVLDQLEKFLPQKPLNIDNIPLGAKDNQFQQLMKSYFKTKFICQNLSDDFLSKGVRNRACKDYFDSSYRLADLLNANKLFSMDPYITENDNFKNLIAWPLNDTYIKPMLRELPTKSIFNGCDLIIDTRPDLKKIYIGFLKNQFYELDSYGKKYLKDNAKSQKCQLVREWSS